MRSVRDPFERPDEKRPVEKKARRLEWITIGFLVTAIIAMYVTMGGSQAMKTAWIEDMLSLIPPISVLLAFHASNRRPTKRFPYGYARSMAIAFLAAAAALTIMGLFLVYDSGLKLLHAEHPTIGQLELFGIRAWAGWWMIGALAYTGIGPVILGRMKLPLAKQLHNKALHADADMNKADWMTAGAGIVGILGVGLGFWWADAVAALFIAFNILKDGLTNLVHAASDLMDQRPTTVDRSEPLHLEERIVEYLKALEWVERSCVRLREEGEGLTGEAFVVPTDGRVTAARVDEARAGILGLDWRLFDVVVSPTREIDEA